MVFYYKDKTETREIEAQNYSKAPGTKFVFCVLKNGVSFPFSWMIYLLNFVFLMFALSIALSIYI